MNVVPQAWGRGVAATYTTVDAVVEDIAKQAIAM